MPASQEPAPGRLATVPVVRRAIALAGVSADRGGALVPAPAAAPEAATGDGASAQPVPALDPPEAGQAAGTPAGQRSRGPAATPGGEATWRRKPVLAAATAVGATLLVVPLVWAGGASGDPGKTDAVQPLALSTSAALPQSDALATAAGTSSAPSATSASSAVPAASPAQPQSGAHAQSAAAAGGALGAKTGTVIPRGTTTAAQQPPSTPGQAAGARTPDASAAAAVLVVGAGSNRCVDVTNAQDGIGRDGTRLQLWDCAGTPNQQWTFESDGTVRSMGLCMDVAGGSVNNGAAVQLAWCSGNPAQQWVLSPAGDLVNPPANKCLDAVDEGTANGTSLQIWDCAGSSNQKWRTATR